MQATVVEALRAQRLMCHAEGGGIYVANHGHLTVAEAAVLANELEEGRRPRPVGSAPNDDDENLCADLTRILADSLGLVGELATHLEIAHTAVLLGMRTILACRVEPPAAMKRAIQEAHEVLARARRLAPLAGRLETTDAVAGVSHG